MARYIDAENIPYYCTLVPNEDPRKCYFKEIADKRDVDKLPTISTDDVRGVGKWKMWEDYYGSNVYQCAVCGADWDMIDGTPEDNDMNYCPSCGAKMEGTSDGI